MYTIVTMINEYIFNILIMYDTLNTYHQLQIIPINIRQPLYKFIYIFNISIYIYNNLYIYKNIKEQVKKELKAINILYIYIKYIYLYI